MRFVYIGVLLVVLLLTACSPEEEAVVLPTRIDVNAIATQNEQLTRAAIASVATATLDPDAINQNRPTLPPTWTVSPFPTNTVAPPTPTAEVIDTGRIFYIYNGDSIISMNADGTDSQFILTFGVGAVIEDMVISPDRAFLAFAGPGNGSAREVWVSNLDGTFTQQVSCVGYAQVSDVTWSPDSASVAFFAYPNAGAIAEVFTANVEGSGNCPTDNAQRSLFSTETTVPGDLIWSANGTSLFYSLQGIRQYEFATGQLSDEITSTTGFGPDFDFAFNPANPAELAYIRRSGLVGTRQIPFGRGLIIDIREIPIPVSSTVAIPGEIVNLHWLTDGESMVLSGNQTISFYSRSTSSATPIISGLQIPPMAIINELTDDFVYVGVDPELVGTEQVFAVNRRGRVTPLTAHTEGTVSDLIWIP